MRFIKIATQMFPVERIENINMNAILNGNPGVEVKLFGISDTFQYTGQYAELAYNLLKDETLAKAPPTVVDIVVIVAGRPTPCSSVTLCDGGVFEGSVFIDGKEISIQEIEWIDLDSSINGVQGVEFRVSSDAPGLTRQLTGDAAGAAYDAFVGLVKEQESQQAAG